MGSVPVVVFARNSSTWPTDSLCILEDPGMATDAALLRAVLSVQGIAALTIVVVNAYTMAAIWPRRHRRSTQSTLFVLHLALADILVGLSKLVHIIFSTSCFMATLAATHEVPSARCVERCSDAVRTRARASRQKS